MWDVAFDFPFVYEISNNALSFIRVNVLNFHHLQCGKERVDRDLVGFHEQGHFLEKIPEREREASQID